MMAGKAEGFVPAIPCPKRNQSLRSLGSVQM